MENSNISVTQVAVLIITIFLSSLFAQAQRPLQVNISRTDQEIISYKHPTLLSISPEGNEIDSLLLKEGQYYPKQIGLTAGSYICLPQEGTGTDFSLNEIIKKDGVLYYAWLPASYNIGQTHPTTPILGFTNSPYIASASIPCGFICIKLGSNGRKFDALSIESSNNPIAGLMMFDGNALHPTPNGIKQININLSNNPSEIYFPITPDYTNNLTVKGIKSSGHTHSKNFKDISVKRGETVILDFKPKEKDPLPPDPNRKHKKPGDKEDKENQETKPSEEPCNCDFTPNTTTKEVVKQLWYDLDGENKWAPKQKKNWNSDLPVATWGGVTRSQTGLYDVEIWSGYNMEIPTALVIKLFENDMPSLPKNSPAVDPNEPPIRNRPYGREASKSLPVIIDGCQDLKKLVLVNTEITELIITNCKNLETIGVIGNSIEKLTINCCPKLATVSATANRIETLQISECPEITYLFCPANFIKELDVSGLPKLELLNCAVNLLTKLDVSKNRKLKDLRCYYNLIKTLDLTNNVALKVLYCAANDYIVLTPDINKLRLKGLTKYNIDGKLKY